MTANLRPGDDWVPEACTLPTADQPLRREEFDSLFREYVIRVDHETSQRVLLELRAVPSAASRAAELAVKETGCCSFFGFDLAIAHGRVTLAVTAGPSHEDVLTALAARAESMSGARA